MTYKTGFDLARFISKPMPGSGRTNAKRSTLRQPFAREKLRNQLRMVPRSHNIAKVEVCSYRTNWVFQPQKTFISIDEVREVKEKFRHVKYSRIDKYMRKVFVLNSIIGRT